MRDLIAIENRYRMAIFSAIYWEKIPAGDIPCDTASAAKCCQQMAVRDFGRRKAWISLISAESVFRVANSHLRRKASQGVLTIGMTFC